MDGDRPSGSQPPESFGIKRRVLSQRGGNLGDFIPRQGEFRGADSPETFPEPVPFQLDGRMAPPGKDQPKGRRG